MDATTRKLLKYTAPSSDEIRTGDDSEADGKVHSVNADRQYLSEGYHRASAENPTEAAGRKNKCIQQIRSLLGGFILHMVSATLAAILS